MTGREPIWLEREAIVALHDRSLALHGGPSGVRDLGLLKSALRRPLDRFHYEGETDLAVLAATYTVGIASNHPFIDGNKRAAYQALILFLGLNGFSLSAGRVDAIETIFSIAAGDIDIDALAFWIRANITQR